MSHEDPHRLASLEQVRAIFGPELERSFDQMIEDDYQNDL